ncbi:hypothetical protein RN001_004235 [Aquatica leii]|uniref:Uncharacterized protein n=1 Tax=Aquatica leii TaxID=1421715 RepID=A0AAN7PE66_9COLE|nr:hypothetical protein RN001_004235 [Aquatica leii]
MRWILAVSLLLLIKINQIRTEDNEITEQPDKLDKNLRKALLKALSDLETENDTNKVISGVQEAQTSSFTIITSDKPTSAKTIQPDTVTPYVITNASEYTTTSVPKFIVSSKIAEKTSVTPPTTTTTTEESQAKVEDLQFVAAPLVAAFTVHQDELGIPKSVEPILKQPGQKTVTTKDLEEQRLRALQEIEKKKEEEKRKEDEMKWQAYLQKQEELRLKHEAETKQRFLEEQFRILQERQKQQDYYLRQQQLIYEQQRQKLLEDQKRTNANLIYNNYKQSISVQPAVTFQPQPDQYVDNALQLPTKTYQNFQKPQFVYQQQQQQQLPTQNSLNYQSSFSNPISSNSQNFQPHGNRVFRHESGTGNFVNSDYNQIAQSNRFFRSNPYTYSITPSIQQDYHTNRYVRAPYVNNQLNNLLYYSGIGQGKEQEELNLISKVLAFNIRGDNYYAGSENVEQRLVPPRNYYIRS